MQVTVKGKCVGVYERPPYTDKTTGETQPPAYGLQLLTDVKLKNGATKSELYDIKLDEETSKSYKGKEGSNIELAVSLYSSQNISMSAV